MGAAGSINTSITSRQESLAKGLTQSQVDEYLIQLSLQDIHNMLLPNLNQTPPEYILVWIEDRVTDDPNKDPTRNEKTLEWLKNALVVSHKCSKIATYSKQLLATNYFCENLHYMKLWIPLIQFCKRRLIELGEPLIKYYDDNQLEVALGSYQPPQHPAFIAEGTHHHLRQDHKLVGFAPPKHLDQHLFSHESVYVHALRLVARIVDVDFQVATGSVVTPLGGELRTAAIKGDTRMNNKALADHRHQPKPRPALNIDVNRNCVTFDSAKELVAAADGLVQKFGGYVGRSKNGFTASHAKQSSQFHYRSMMLNFIVDFGCTYGELVQRSDVVALFETYVEQPPENPRGNWNQWRKKAIEAIQHLKSDQMKLLPVKLICETQLILRPYLNARMQMHLFYKIVRAISPEHLYKQFAVEETLRPPNATFDSERLRLIQRACQQVENGNEFALYNAVRSGVSEAVEQVMVLLEKNGTLNVNQTNQSNKTCLNIASELGHFDVVKLLLNHKNIQINLAAPDAGEGAPIITAAENGHVEIVELLLKHPSIDVNQVKIQGKRSALIVACIQGHVDCTRALLQHPELKYTSDVRSNKKLFEYLSLLYFLNKILY